MRIVRDRKTCYGCRACELICAFHQQGLFAPGGGAIRVRKDNRTGIIRWIMGSTCDACEGERQPLCVTYCSYGALSVSREGNSE